MYASPFLLALPTLSGLPSTTMQHNFSNALGKVSPRDPLSLNLRPLRKKGYFTCLAIPPGLMYLVYVALPLTKKARLKSLRPKDSKKFKPDL
ncbi:hypothetical protein DFJ58DRAFT_778352 [Suillus subalutaceus]|uniref:uncharacterized protein n=1 Tax=Suillus subalutaceus TaxID=48586 RepID=UPI001B86DB64|nr:uncharacterized protein DFJ58DRAFT_778352 [Suillus subalutaceus]KAG1860648.1 hypothetical protein DFJ58DRAFT_778352 [Suillus subalutaceus]